MDTISILNIIMGHNFVTLVQGVTVFVLSYHLIMVFICIKFWRKYLERFQSYGSDKSSILINTKGHNSVKTTRSLNSCSLQIV